MHLKSTLKWSHIICVEAVLLWSIPEFHHNMFYWIKAFNSLPKICFSNPAKRKGRETLGTVELNPYGKHTVLNFFLNPLSLHINFFFNRPFKTRLFHTLLHIVPFTFCVFPNISKPLILSTYLATFDFIPWILVELNCGNIENNAQNSVISPKAIFR